MNILSLYPFDVQSITLLTNKSGRTTWRVETEQGIKILKRVVMKPARMLLIAEGHEHLQEHGLQIAAIHRTKTGAICVGAENSAYVLYDLQEGKEVLYYDKRQMLQIMEFIGKFHQASSGYMPHETSKKRSRLGKWHKLFRWKLQELEGNKMLAIKSDLENNLPAPAVIDPEMEQTWMADQFSKMVIESIDEMILRGKQALAELDEGHYEKWSLQCLESRMFCQQDFTLARFIELDEGLAMKELHSITADLPSRDLRVILNKVMKKMSVWDNDLVIELLRKYDQTNPLTKDQYRVLWTDLKFPHLYCSIVHKYFLGQKTSWSDEKYIWAIQNIIAVEQSKQKFLSDFDEFYSKIKA
ncbi:CotS family spore coat protein [Metabacillus idriensis]|uniref:CotS family spore coat protein n=1 Tax=Metabacillus idriensis TaxID=324768 RepID=UPI003D2B271E